MQTIASMSSPEPMIAATSADDSWSVGSTDSDGDGVLLGRALFNTTTEQWTGLSQDI